MEASLRCVLGDAVRLGKILIQTNDVTSEPELHFQQLPKGISKDYVILLDATVATGAAAIMAIHVLVDHGVREDHIIFMTLIAAPAGVHAVAYRFPKVCDVTHFHCFLTCRRLGL